MDLVRVGKGDYSRYEELLLRRDQLRKEASLLQKQYLREFGDMLTAIFQKKIDCIRKKKMIGYCQMSMNRGESVDAAAMHAFLDKEMMSYQNTLNQMIADNQAVQHVVTITAEVVSKIKRLYHKLAKQLHPDINPETGKIPELSSLWQMVVTAYNANDLEELEEAEALVQQALKTLGIGRVEIELPDIEEKIEKVKNDILKIKTTDPYQYRYLLEDKAAVENKKLSLQKELDEYSGYEQELDQYIERLMKKGGFSMTWIMK